MHVSLSLYIYIYIYTYTHRYRYVYTKQLESYVLLTETSSARPALPRGAGQEDGAAGGVPRGRPEGAHRRRRDPRPQPQNFSSAGVSNIP